MRRSKPVDPNGDRRGHIKDIASIRQRPATIEDRAVPGHWKGDLLSGPDNSYIATSRWPSGTARRYFIEITLEKHDDKVLEPLRPRARQHPQVLKAHTVTGD
jgi:IS30 family transposase